MKLPGFLRKMQDDLARVPESYRSIVNRDGGLKEKELQHMLLNPTDHTLATSQPPTDENVLFYHDQLESYALAGSEAIANRSVAYCILAGGCGTRVGQSKALLRIPELNMSLLTLKLLQAVGTGPIWIMVPKTFRAEVEAHVKEQIGIQHDRITYVEQFESYRFTPDNQLMFCDGRPELYPCGTGDILQLMFSDELKSSGVKHVAVVNVDNVFASLDPSVVGHHIRHESKVTCEVVRRKDKECGYVLVDGPDGLQIVNISNVQDSHQEYTWLSTGSWIIDLSQLSYVKPKWHRRQKTVDGRIVIQHERSIVDVTAAVPTTYLGTIRSERYMPVTTAEDLQQVRRLVHIT